MGRAPCCEKVGLKKGRWTAEEDEILAKYIQANGEGSWRSLPKNAGLLRCGKSCRLRWINYLRTDLKRGNISAEEEDTIVKLHASFGNRWSLIASHLPGRTDNEIKNYWNSHLSREIYRFSKVPGVMDIPPPPQRKGGRTSRWAMKKNKSNTQKRTRTTLTPRQVIISPENNEALVTAPQTPPLDSEGLSNVVEVVDEARKEELGLELELEVGAKTRNEKCLETDDDTSGLYEVEGFNGDSGALCFSDMMDSCLLGRCGVSTLNEERGEGNYNDVVVGVVEENERSNDAGPNKILEDPDLENSVNLSSKRESEEWYSCAASMHLGLDDEWDWESVMDYNDHNSNKSNNEPDGWAWEYKENVLTGLWEDDDWESDPKILGELDPQRQNDIIAWFLS